MSEWRDLTNADHRKSTLHDPIHSCTFDTGVVDAVTAVERRSGRWPSLVAGAVAACCILGWSASGFSATRHLAPEHQLGASKGPAVGSTQTVANTANQTEALKLISLTDPATVAAGQFVTPDPTAYYVAVTFTIKNRSAGVDIGDMDANTSIIVTGKQQYWPIFDALSGCTNFTDGQYTLKKDASETGCVDFQVPTGVKVVQVVYNPDEGFAPTSIKWSAKSGS